MMLEFKLWGDDRDVDGRPVLVDPAFVASVVETERRRAYGGYSPVAVIRMADGAEHVVYDEARSAGRLVSLAKAAANY